MTPAAFLAWRQRLGMTAKAAAGALGCSRNTVAAYEAGRVTIPRYIALACAALAYGIKPME